MPQVPSQLQAVKTDLEGGKRRWAMVKTLLSWFGKKGRGKNVVETIQEALNETGLFHPSRVHFRKRTRLHRVQEFGGSW